MTTKRDAFIDFFKGLLILWVIHIHTVFGSGTMYIPEVVRQVSLLIDIPAFFFISGYLTKASDLITSFKKTLKQFVNLYSNYLIFGFVMLIPLCLYFLFKHRTFPDLSLLISSVFMMLNLQLNTDIWRFISFYLVSIWYMEVYFSILFLVPIAMIFFGSRFLRLFTLSTLFVAFYFCRYLGWKHDFLFTTTDLAFFYLFIFMLGVAYRVDEENIPISFLRLSFLFNLSLAFAAIIFKDAVFSIQKYKFPPSMDYLIYSLLIIHLFLIIKSVGNYQEATANNQIFRLFEWSGRNVFFIYLMQGVVCSFPHLFVPSVLKYLHPLMIYLIVLGFNEFFTLLFTFLYLKVRRVILDFTRIGTWIS